MVVLYVFFFKQKTAYELRISDWSSDVCSSDLPDRDGDGDGHDDVHEPARCLLGEALPGRGEGARGQGRWTHRSDSGGLDHRLDGQAQQFRIAAQLAAHEYRRAQEIGRAHV